MSSLPRLFWGNVSFERQLEESRSELPQSLRRLEAELSSMWLAFARPGDVIYCSEPVPDEFWQQYSFDGGVQCWDGVATLHPNTASFAFTPWGWSSAAIRQAQRWSCKFQGPPIDVVRYCNSREFSAHLEQELNCQLTGARSLHSMEELAAAITGFERWQRWVIKANLGHAGRERVLGAGPSPDDSVVRWVQRRFARGQALYFEPWVDQVAEVGVQWDIPQQGEPQLLGLTTLISNARGAYVGSCVVDGLEADWGATIARQRCVVRVMQQRGYFGPVGIDAMRFRDEAGGLRDRPLQDINARLTMGRVALEWSNRFQSRGCWMHAAQAPDAAAIPTSPESLGGMPVTHRTWWISGAVLEECP